ncbi:hypothetical protein [Brevibacillus agri]|uniref:hypothetical protein n=1 Tax=Brevibacillus agri TaxID=51101 RepID=UPI002E1B4180|nr:hypothetical protein [Brevibacillus agri]
MSPKMPIACCHTVFTEAERVEYKSIWEELDSRRISIAELEKGVQYQFPEDQDTLRLVQEWVRLERKCCPFLTFTVIASSEENPILLELTGNDEAKAFLRNEMEAEMKRITCK